MKVYEPAGTTGTAAYRPETIALAAIAIPVPYLY